MDHVVDFEEFFQGTPFGVLSSKARCDRHRLTDARRFDQDHVKAFCTEHLGRGLVTLSRTL